MSDPARIGGQRRADLSRSIGAHHDHLDFPRVIRVHLHILIISKVEEHLSLAYLRAVAGRVNVALAEYSCFDVGIDGILSRVRQTPFGYYPDSRNIHFQLKSTFNLLRAKGAVKLDVEAKSYNKIVHGNSEFRTIGGSPCILIVYCLPKSEEEWLDVNDERLIMRECCYWGLLEGDPTENDRKYRVTIPERQKLTPVSLLGIFDRMSEGSL
jgi:hypothetical protein